MFRGQSPGLWESTLGRQIHFLGAWFYVGHRETIQVFVWCTCACVSMSLVVYESLLFTRVHLCVNLYM